MAGKFHQRTLPGESEAYRSTRNELLQEELDLIPQGRGADWYPRYSYSNPKDKEPDCCS